MKSVDLSTQEIVTAQEIDMAGKSGATEIIVGIKAVLNEDARSLLGKSGIALKFSCNSGSHAPSKTEGTTATDPRMQRCFHSREAEAAKEEICAVSRKLWLRSFVDGNGGNISYRIGDNEVLCTPTLMSKFDLIPEDICLVDLEGRQIAGSKQCTSEIYLHLEIYKEVSQAKAVVHCHPPHATAYAISGHVPPTAIIPEFDVFVGSVAITPYETPGTKAFAETIRPYIHEHNTILLGNHGIVCWADTPTHAEWYAENLETYCSTLLISKQLGVQYTRIPFSKEMDLLEIKKRLGLPDARFHKKDEGRYTEAPEPPGSIALISPVEDMPAPACALTATDADIEAIAEAVTARVLAALNRG
jgi:L-fuculose-phosphate aldolase